MVTITIHIGRWVAPCPDSPDAGGHLPALPPAPLAGSSSSPCRRWGAPGPGPQTTSVHTHFLGCLTQAPSEAPSTPQQRVDGARWSRLPSRSPTTGADGALPAGPQDFLHQPRTWDRGRGTLPVCGCVVLWQGGPHTQISARARPGQMSPRKSPAAEGEATEVQARQGRGRPPPLVLRREGPREKVCGHPAPLRAAPGRPAATGSGAFRLATHNSRNGARHPLERAGPQLQPRMLRPHA